MLYPVSYSQVAVCAIIILQIWPVIALTGKIVSTPIISCEDNEVKLYWEYELNPKEYVEAKTWSYTKNKNAILIANWKYTSGVTLDPNFNDRVTIIGNDSLLIRNITTKDDGTYTLTLFLRQSSQQNPKFHLNLTVLKPPLEGCCKPTIQRFANRTGLQANLNTQACGTEPFQLKWNNASGTTSKGDILIFNTTYLTGRFTVCVTGLTVETCFKGKNESLCREEYIEKTSESPETVKLSVTLIAVLCSVGTLIVLILIAVIIIVLNRRRIKKYRKRNKNWRAVRASYKFQDDDRILQSLILTENEKMDIATMEISNIMYFVYNNSKELALAQINTRMIALENSEITYIDNEDGNEAGGVLTANHGTNPSYAQCLYHNNKQLKLLVLKGELGMGKTMWCRKFVKTWCEAHECQYHGTSIQNEAENIQTLKLFPLLFFLSLRNVDRGSYLKEIIKQQCMIGRDTKNGHFGDNLDLLMEKRPDKLIFIIHGVDEADADVDIFDTIISQTKNSLTILTCCDWEPSKYRIQEEDYRPMACITLKQIDTKNVTLYANSIFNEYGYPKNAVSEFMELVRRNQLEKLIEEAYFVQPLIQIWYKSSSLPSDTTDVCLCLIEDNLKVKTKQLMEYTTLSLDLDVDKFVPKARGKIFVIRYGKVLCCLGKVALLCLGNKISKNIFYEDDLICMNISGKRLTEICIAAKLVSTAPVSDSARGNKRLCFRHDMIQLFLVAFHLACEGESRVKDTDSEQSKIIQGFLTSLTS